MRKRGRKSELWRIIYFVGLHQFDPEEHAQYVVFLTIFDYPVKLFIWVEEQTVKLI